MSERGGYGAPANAVRERGKHCLGVSRYVRAVAGENGGLVVLHTRTGQWYLLNRSGAVFWEALAEGRPIEATAVALALRYPAVGHERIRGDLQRLVADLMRAGLVRPRRRAAAHGNPAAVPMALPERRPLRLPVPDLLAAAAGVAVAIGLTRLPFWLIVRLLRLVKRVIPRAARRDEAMAAVLATRQLARFTPTRAACLELSLAAVVAAALRGRRLDMCLGLRADPMRFHAWVEVDGSMVVHPADEPADRSYRVALRV